MKSWITLPLLALALLAMPAQAQVDYDQLADIDDLTNGGTLGDVEIDCMDAYTGVNLGLDDPIFVFYNSASENLMGYNPIDEAAAGGGNAFIIESASDLDIAIPSRSRCRALTVDDFGDIYMAIEVVPTGASGGELTLIYRSSLSCGSVGGPCGSVLAVADGTTGIDVDNDAFDAAGCLASGGPCGLVFLAISEFQSDFGEHEDGFYVLEHIEDVAAGGPTHEPVEIYTDADLDLLDLQFTRIFGPPSAAGAQDFLVSVSSEFAGGDYANVAVALPLGVGGAAGGGLETIWEPCSDGTFSNCTDGGIEDVEVILDCPDPLAGGCSPVLYVYNNSFTATDGEQWGAAYGDGEMFSGGGPIGIRFAEQTPMLADPDVTIAEYTGTIGTSMVARFDGTVYAASTTFASGEDAIIAMRNAPVPVELTAFDVFTTEDGAVLRWATASETNNAGFEVQVQQGENWDVLGFVNGNGTTTEAQTYSFDVDLLPGTYTFRLKQIDFDGQFEFFGNVEATVGTPGTHLLSNVYPNPFNPQATFDLSVATAQDVTIDLYNVLGQRVATIFEGAMEANANLTFTIDGAGLATGAYVVRINGERFNATRQITLMK